MAKPTKKKKAGKGKAKASDLKRVSGTGQLSDKEADGASGGAIYLKYGDIQGESTSGSTDKWIELTSIIKP